MTAPFLILTAKHIGSSASARHSRHNRALRATAIAAATPSASAPTPSSVRGLRAALLGLLSSASSQSIRDPAPLSANLVSPFLFDLPLTAPETANGPDLYVQGPAVADGGNPTRMYSSDLRWLHI